MSLSIGIDPGAESGAIAVIAAGNLVAAIDMPCADRIIAARLLAEELRELALAEDAAPLVAIERVHAMPKQGVSSSFKFGRSLGVIEGVVAGIGWPVVWVTPQTWKKHYGLLRQEKDAARMLAIETWPQMSNEFKRKKDCGRADAALIAKWADVTHPGRAT